MANISTIQLFLKVVPINEILINKTEAFVKE